LISLHKTATEMERLEALRAAFSESYGLAIRAAAEYAIELDPREASDFRDSLKTLAAQVKSADASEPVRQVEDSFRMALRSYHERAQARIDRLRKDVDAGAAAVAAFAGTVASHGADHQAQVNTELAQLREMTAWEELPEIRRGLHSAIFGITEAVEQMQRSTQMTIAQLRDEIHTLHHSMESTRRAAATDLATGAWNRQKSEHRIHDLLKENEAFRVLLISVTNLKQVEERFSPAVAEGALKQLTLHLRDIVGVDPPIGRWAENEFVVLLDLDPASAMALSREASLKLSAAYTLPGSLCSMPIQLEVATGLIERAGGTDDQEFLKKLEQLSAALVSN
jgi:GGDEF domain-containing protein